MKKNSNDGFCVWKLIRDQAVNGVIINNHSWNLVWPKTARIPSPNLLCSRSYPWIFLYNYKFSFHEDSFFRKSAKNCVDFCNKINMILITIPCCLMARKLDYQFKNPGWIPDSAKKGWHFLSPQKRLERLSNSEYSIRNILKV